MKFLLILLWILLGYYIGALITFLVVVLYIAVLRYCYRQMNIPMRKVKWNTVMNNCLIWPILWTVIIVMLRKKEK